MADIDWKKCSPYIRRTSWVRSSPTERLEAARQDLQQAGCVEEAQKLTLTRLNTAWQGYVTAQDKATILAERRKSRDSQKKNKRSRSEDQGQRLQDASTNALIAASLGIAPRTGDGEYGGDDEEDEMDGAPGRKFHLEVLRTDGEDNDNPNVFLHANVSAVLATKGQYDEEARDVLLIRVVTPGTGVQISAGRVISDSSIIFDINRENQDDFVRQLNPLVSPEVYTTKVQQLEGLTTKKYGSHMTYKVINNAFRAMAPNLESWTLTVRVDPPFLIGEATDVTQFTGKGGSDALVLIPLRTVVPSSRPEATQIKLFE